MTNDTQADKHPDRNQRIIDAIKLYLRLGLAVIPVPRGDKRAEIKWGAFAEKRPGQSDWNAWWRATPGCNLAVVYSSSAAPEGKQLVCVDTDSPEAEAWVTAQRPLPPTATATTAKGKHRYYYAPAGLTHYQGGEGMPEVRAGVHYSILPPSLHPSGMVYEWDEYLGPAEAGIADLPDWGVALMGEPEPVTDAEAQRVEQDPVPEGRRNDTLFRQCARWRAASVPDEQLRASAHAFNRDHCKPPLDASEVDSVVKSVLRYAPGTSVRVQETDRRQEQQQPAPAQEDCGYSASLAASAEAAVNAVPAPQRIIGARPVSEDAMDVLESVDARRYLDYKVHGMRTGWQTLDWHFLGFKHQGLIWVGGASGSSKSTLMRHTVFATCEAIEAERLCSRILVYALEGGKEQFLRYFAGYKYGLSIRLFQPGGAARITEDEQERMLAAYSEYPSLPLDICTDMRNADQIMFDIERRAAEGAIEGVILDNVQLLEFHGRNQWADNQRTALKALDLADRFEFPFIALSQVNKTREGIKPRGGPEWYNNATATFFIERGESGDSDAQKQLSNKTTLMNLKARYLTSCCRPIVLIGDRETGRLYEEAPDNQQHASVGGASAEWPGND